MQKEPKEALFGGEKGYEILEEIIHFSLDKKVKFLACEFGYDQKEILEKFYIKIISLLIFSKMNKVIIVLL